MPSALDRLRATQPPTLGDRLVRFAGQRRRRLHARTGGHGFVGVVTNTGRSHRPANTARTAAERAPPPVSTIRSTDTVRGERVDAVEQAAHDAIDRGPGELLAA